MGEGGPRASARKRLPPLPRSVVRRRDEAAAPRSRADTSSGPTRGGASGGAAVLGRLFPIIERLLPPAPPTVAFIRSRAPDVVLVSPLIGLGSSQADYVRAARRLGVPTVFPVHSWDNLTEQGPDPRRARPDARLEPGPGEGSDRVARRSPRARRGDRRGCVRSLVRLGHPPRRGAVRRARRPAGQASVVLWVCSSPFIAPDEVSFRSSLARPRSGQRARRSTTSPCSSARTRRTQPSGQTCLSNTMPSRSGRAAGRIRSTWTGADTTSTRSTTRAQS